MRIGELSRRTGVSIRLLRYYEQQGLLTPAREPGGYRVYREEDGERVRRIRLLLAAGLSTKRIGWALGGLCDQDGQLTPCPGLASGLREERARIDETISALLATRDVLDQVIAGNRPSATRVM
jgi:DNA-binding transcriptional MerR regulator